MAYCRWSDCDVYVYEDVGGGWTTHVAGRRRVAGKAPDINFTSVETIQATYAARNAWYEAHPEMNDIGLPCDGESYNDASPGECADRLQGLKAMGYDVPDEVIDELREEHKDFTP